MYARITESRVYPSNRRKAEQIAVESIIPAAEQQPGYEGAILATNEDGQTLLMTFWVNEETMRRTESGPYWEKQVARVQSLLSQPPVAASGEVVRFESTGAPAKAGRFHIMPMQAGKREETLAIGRKVAEQASRAPGFVGWIAVWTEKEEAAALSLWDSMDTIRLQASSERARDVMADSRRRMQPLAANRLRGGEFEVAYCKLPSGIAAQSRRFEDIGGNAPNPSEIA